MKHTAFKTLLVAAAALLPSLASAHPGHSAFDALSGLPHAGHESEYGMFFLAASAVIALAFRAWLKARE
jgi:hypothetical protein